MAYRIDNFRTLDDEIRRIGLEQIDLALASLADTALPVSKRIHEARKRCKRIRALVRLVRPALPKKSYRAANRHFRDAARRVSKDRDLVVLIETYDSVADRSAGELDRRRTASIRAAFTRRLKAFTEARASADKLQRLTADFESGRTLIEGFEFDSADFEPIVEGVSRVRARARRGLDAAMRKSTPEAYHEWRKRVKYLRRHLQLLRTLWPRPMAAMAEEAAQLGDRLGDAHDLAELIRDLQDNPDGLGNPLQVQAFSGFAGTLQQEIEMQSLLTGRRLLAESDKSLRNRLRAWHEILCGA